MTTPLKYFKIYGHLRTGTNYISSLIINNFLETTIFMNIGGWKHGKIIEYPNNDELVNTVNIITKKNIDIYKTINLFKNNNVKFIVMIKNPYMWICSVSIFTKKVINRRFVIKYITHWNDIYSNYKDYIECGKAHLVKYETLLQEPHETLENIKNKYNLTKKNLEYILENNILCANNDTNIGKTKNMLFNKNKYISPNIKNHLSNDIINIINENIDKTLMKFYEYEIVIV
jgi:hypothetical protein